MKWWGGKGKTFTPKKKEKEKEGAPSQKGLMPVLGSSFKGVHTMLKESIYKLLHKIKKEPFFKWTPKMQGDPSTQN